MSLPPHLADLEGRLASRVDEALAGFRRAFEARLRGATERLLAEATDVPQPAFEGLFAEVERAALEEAPRREGAKAAVDSLVDAARAFDRATSQGDVLTALVAAGRTAAERLALFLLRDERLVAFESAGCDGRLARGRELAFEGALREGLDAAGGCRAIGVGDAATVAERLGLDAGGDAVVVPLVLRDQVAALLWADTKSGAPNLAALQLLAAMAAQRLELQALSSRSFTPTLYDDDEAPGEPLPHWSAVRAMAPPPPPEAEREDRPLEETPSFEIVAVESHERVAAPLDSEAAVEAAIESGWEPSAEPQRADGGEVASAAELERPWSGTTIEIEAAGDAVAELFEAAPEAADAARRDEAPGFPWQEEEEPAPSEPAPEPAIEKSPFVFEAEPGIEAAESGVAFEPVDEAPDSETSEFEMPGVEAPAGEEPAPAPPAPWTEPAGGADLLGTVRMPILNFPLAGAQRMPEETTAPVRVREVAPPAPLAAQGASTHEFPAPEPVSDVEATVLSRRSPLMPAEPPFGGAPPPLLTVPLATPAQPVPIVPPATQIEDPMDRTASRMRSTEVAPPPDLQGPGRAFLSGRAQRTVADQPTHEEAKRLARLLISEIKLYNEEQVLEGRRNRDLYHRLKEDIDRSRQIYEERVDPAVRQSSDYFQQELVRSLAGGDPRALGI